jgi:uncharacterized protein
MKTLLGKMLVGTGAAALLMMSAAAPAALAQTASASAAAASEAPKPATFSLSATGEVRLKPDVASITLGVTAEAPTAADAVRQNAIKMNQVLAALKKAGLADKDIQTSSLNLAPQYVYQENLPPRLTGYQVSNQVTVTVHDLSKLGQAVDAVVGAGATNIGNISFGLDDPKAAEDQARLKAVAALQAKADLYARATGLKIARLASLSEGGGYSPPSPMPMMMMARMDKSESTPVSAGEVSVRIDVSAVYELAR